MRGSSSRPLWCERSRRTVPLQEQLARCARLRLEDVPRLRRAWDVAPLQSTRRPEVPQRVCGGVNARWLERRRGRLTASHFAAALGFHGKASAHRLTRKLGAGASADVQQSDPGVDWGQRHEASGLATYLSSYLSAACPSAEAHETGFWPFEVSHPSGARASVGATPDAIVRGAEQVWPGGLVVEVKCPFRGGQPAPHVKVLPRMMPQLQGQLLATGAATLHLVSWSPYGSTVFRVTADLDYQREMGEALALVARQATGDGEELGRLSRAVRERSVVLAKRSERVALIPPSECVSVYDGPCAVG